MTSASVTLLAAPVPRRSNEAKAQGVAEVHHLVVLVFGVTGKVLDRRHVDLPARLVPLGEEQLTLLLGLCAIDGGVELVGAVFPANDGHISIEPLVERREPVGELSRVEPTVDDAPNATRPTRRSSRRRIAYCSTQ
jgi:hypothetical protein